MVCQRQTRHLLPGHWIKRWLGGLGAGSVMTVSLPSLAMVARSFRRADLAVLVAGVLAMGVLAAGAAIALGF